MGTSVPINQSPLGDLTSVWNLPDVKRYKCWKCGQGLNGMSGDSRVFHLRLCKGRRQVQWGRYDPVKKELVWLVRELEEVGE